MVAALSTTVVDTVVVPYNEEVSFSLLFNLNKEADNILVVAGNNHLADTTVNLAAVDINYTTMDSIRVAAKQALDCK